MKLAISALIKFIFGVLIVGILIFVPAGTIRFFNGWLLMSLMFVPIIILGIYLLKNNPKLLERRLNSKEKIGTQKLVVFISCLLFIIGFVVCGLDFKYNWSNVPNYVVILSCFSLLLGYLLYFNVLKENEYLLRTIEVEKEQKLIDTGLYGLVRHPMYLSVIIMFLSIPLILGSLYGFYIFLVFPLILIIRLHSEEKVLVKELKGYSKYKLKVKYKLFPYIW